MNKEEAGTNLNRALKPLYEKFGSKTSLLTKFGRWQLEENPHAQTPFVKAILDNKPKWKSFKRVIESGKPFISFIPTEYGGWRRSYGPSYAHLIKTQIDIKKISYFYNIGEELLDCIILRLYMGNSGSKYFLNLNKTDYKTMGRGIDDGDGVMWFKWPLFHDFEEYILIEDLVGWEIPFLNWQTDNPLEVKR
jgi:hypothetical protein